MNFIDDEARVRIERRGISQQDIYDCLNIAGRTTYVHRGNTVYAATLPDGRNLKVSIDSLRNIVNAFIHQ